MAMATDTLERASAEETGAIRDRRQERIDALQAAFADFHRARSIVTDPKNNDEAVMSDDELEAACDLEADAIHRITALRAIRPFQVWSKFNVLDYLMTDEGEGLDRSDRRLVALVGSIKADLLRLGIAEGKKT